MTPAAPVPQVTPGVAGLGGTPPRAPRSRLGRALERLLAPFALLLGLAGALATMLATRTTAVGVIVETASRPGPSDVVTSPGATYMVAGLTERGPTDQAVEVLSLADYVDRFGDRVSYGALYDDLAMYFSEGGTRAFVARVVGTTPTVGTLTLNDRAGSPLATVRIDALNAGSWSTRVSVAVADAPIANRVTITVLYDGVAVETYPNLATPADVVAAIVGRSSYVTAVDLASATAAPNNRPAVLAATPLSAGTDDRGTVVAGHYTAALDRFLPDLGAGAVAIPGQAASAVGSALIAHAKANARLALLAPAAAQSVAQAKAATVGLLTTSGAEHAGLFYPWVKIDDGTTGGTRTVSPEGYVAGVRARAHRQAGPWRAPAGQIARAQYVLDVERKLTRAEVNDLNANQVSPIAIIAGAPELYGWRSLSTDTRNYALLTGRDVMNEVAALGAERLEAYTFGTVDSKGHYLAELEAEMRAVLEPMLSAGGLYERTDPATGELQSAGYTVDTGPAVNTPEVLARNEVRVDVALRVSPTGELIRLRITKVAFDSAI